MTLVDTDVLIWYLRGRSRARVFLDEQHGLALSSITYMELVQGMRDGAELRTLRRTLADWHVPVLPVTESISHRAVFYVERHFLSHALRLADALIAATAVEHALPLATGNVKHYRVIDEVEIIPFQP